MKKMMMMDDDTFGCLLVLAVCGFIAALVFGAIKLFERQELAGEKVYSAGTIQQGVKTAKTDIRSAKKLFASGRAREADEALGKAEDKLARGGELKADAAVVSALESGIGEVESQNSSYLIEVRRNRGKARLAGRAKGMRTALRRLEYRSRLTEELLRLVQARMARAKADAGVETYMENPFRVEPERLREAMEKRYGLDYAQEMERLEPGAPEQAVQSAQRLAEQADSSQ